jgi:hypothetical protein
VCQDPILLGPASEPKANGSCVRIQGQWVRHQDPILLVPRQDLILLGLASGLKINGSGVRIQGSWVIRFLNIIICIINIAIFNIIKSINIKNIIIFIIINIINKIINEFENKNKNYYFYYYH